MRTRSLVAYRVCTDSNTSLKGAHCGGEVLCCYFLLGPRIQACGCLENAFSVERSPKVHSYRFYYLWRSSISPNDLF